MTDFKAAGTASVDAVCKAGPSPLHRPAAQARA